MWWIPLEQAHYEDIVQLIPAYLSNQNFLPVILKIYIFSYTVFILCACVCACVFWLASLMAHLRLTRRLAGSLAQLALDWLGGDWPAFSLAAIQAEGRSALQSKSRGASRRTQNTNTATRRRTCVWLRVSVCFRMKFQEWKDKNGFQELPDGRFPRRMGRRSVDDTSLWVYVRACVLVRV